MGVRVSRKRIGVADAYEALEDPLSGGVAIFIGRVRPDRKKGAPVLGLFYEAHVEVAEAQLRELEAEARRRFGARKVLLWHRLGTLAVGTPSVLIGVAAPHRASAFAACRYLIDRLKSEVPIWKSDRVRPGRRRPRRRVRPPAR